MTVHDSPQRRVCFACFKGLNEFFLENHECLMASGWVAGAERTREAPASRAGILFPAARARYIPANPVRHGLVIQPEDWKWSSAGWLEGKNSLYPDPVDFGVFSRSRVTDDLLL